METPLLHGLRADVQRLLTCAPGAPCPREESCFRVAKTLLKLLPEPIATEPEADPDPDEVQYYCCWEASVRPDWSAA
jgi:hypothetical protein